MEIIFLLIISITIWLIIYLGGKKIIRTYKHRSYPYGEIFIDTIFLITSLVNLLFTGQLFTIILDARFEEKFSYDVYLGTIAFIFFGIVAPGIISFVRSFLYGKYLRIQISPLFTTISYLNSLIGGILIYIIASNFL